MAISGVVDFPIEWVRDQFPSVRAGEAEHPSFVFMDNAGGAQVPHAVLVKTQAYFRERNVYHAGPYRRALATREAVGSLRTRLAAFTGASSDEEIVFGLNATTLLSLFAHALRENFEPGDEIITTCLEHEANVTPWLRLEKNGVVLRFWKPAGSDARLDADDLRAMLTGRTRLIAVTGASNIVGTITDMPAVSRVVHETGAILLVDAVHLAPHRRIDIVRDGIDAVFCSAYKMFGPHLGFAACRRTVLDRLSSLNHLFLSGKAKLELGMQNSEGLAALEGVLQYFDDLAGELGVEGSDPFTSVFDAIAAYERTLAERLIGGLCRIRGVHVYGITEPGRFDKRTPTAAFTLDGRTPQDVARRLGALGFGVNCGHMYAPRVIEWLGLGDTGGVVRASLCHYNTIEEIERFLNAVGAVASGCD